MAAITIIAITDAITTTDIVEMVVGKVVEMIAVVMTVVTVAIGTVTANFF
jgi:uncharacterized membrane protein YwzB